MSELFNRIYETYVDRLFRFATKIVHNREEALDLVQDVFVKLLRTGKQTLDTVELKQYLFAATYNQALNTLRNKKIQSAKLTELTTDTPASRTNNIAQSTFVTSLINKLSEKQQQVIIYRFYSDLTLKEIAETMQISDGSVKVHLSRALYRLKELMTDKTKERLL